MSHRRPKPEQLWQFLCPALRLNAPKRHFSTVPLTRRPRCPPAAPIDTNPRCLQAPNSSVFARHIHSEGHPSTSSDNAQGHSMRKGRNGPGLNLARTAPEDVPTEAHENGIIPFARLYRDPARVMHILRVLLKDRGVQLKARHYQALILCNTNPQQGSAAIVRDLLWELNNSKITINSDILHAALEGMHPDSFLRQDILRISRENWLSISPEGWNYVVAGLIREHEFELALDHLANMERKGIVIKDWLHSLLIYYLLAFQEFDQVLQLMDARLEKGHEMTKELSEHVLETAAAAHHDALISFVWKKIVTRGIELPPHHLCDEVIESAERTGDKDLAASVTHMIEQTELKHNFAAGSAVRATVCRGNFESGNLYGALETWCDSKSPVNDDALRPMVRSCLAKGIYAQYVWDTLKDLKAAGKTIPESCAKLVLRLFGADAAVGRPRAIEKTLSFYKDIHTLCGQTPSVWIFGALLSVLRTTGDVDGATFVLKEMETLGVERNWHTSELIILIALKAEDLKACYRFLDYIEQQGLRPTLNAYSTLRKTLESEPYKDTEPASKVLNHPVITQVAFEFAEYHEKREEQQLESRRLRRIKRRDNRQHRLWGIPPEAESERWSKLQQERQQLSVAATQLEWKRQELLKQQRRPHPEQDDQSASRDASP